MPTRSQTGHVFEQSLQWQWQNELDGKLEGLLKQAPPVRIQEKVTLLKSEQHKKYQGQIS